MQPPAAGAQSKLHVAVAKLRERAGASGDSRRTESRRNVMRREQIRSGGWARHRTQQAVHASTKLDGWVGREGERRPSGSSNGLAASSGRLHPCRHEGGEACRQSGPGESGPACCKQAAQQGGWAEESSWAAGSGWALHMSASAPVLGMDTLRPSSSGTPHRPMSRDGPQGTTRAAGARPALPAPVTSAAICMEPALA